MRRILLSLALLAFPALLAAQGPIVTPSRNGGGSGGGGVTGTGTATYLACWISGTAIADCNATDTGSLFTINEPVVLGGTGQSAITLFDGSGNPTTPTTGQVPTCGTVTSHSCAIAWGTPAAGSSTVVLPNDTGTGTTTGKLVKLSATAGATTALLATGTTVGIIGVATSGAGTSGNVTVTTSGLVNCVFVGATTVNDYVTNDSSTGDCSDTGAITPPLGSQLIGRVLSTNVGAGTYQVELFAPGIIGAAAAGNSTTTAHYWLGNQFETSQSPLYGLIGTNDTSVNWYAAGGGTGNAQTVTLTQQMTAYTAGVIVTWLPSNANTAATTINVSALGTKSVTKCGTTALASGDLSTTAVAEALYDGTRFQLLNPQAAGCGVPAIPTIASTANVLKGDGSGNAVSAGFAATGAGIVTLFSACSGTQYLGADGSCHTAGTSPTTNQNIRTIGASFGDFSSGASAISGAQIACVPSYFAGTISAVELIATPSGSVTVDVKTVAHGSFTGPASTSSITASDIPALASATTYSDTTLTGWTTSVSAGTDFCFYLTSPTTVAGVAISVKMAAN